MDERTRQTFTRMQVFSAMVVGSLGLLIFGLQPILLGELVNGHRVSLEGTGIVAMAEIIAVAAGVTVGDLWMQTVHVRRIALLAALAAAGLDLATLGMEGDWALTLLRTLEGLAEGVLAWVAISVVVRSDSPERLGGQFVSLQTALQAVVAVTLALVVIPRLGWQGGFATLAAIKLLPLLLWRQIVVRLSPQAQAAGIGWQGSPRRLLGLAVPLLQFCAAIAIWAYLEPLGQAIGLDSRFVQLLVFAVLLLQVLSAQLAAQVVEHLPDFGVLVAGSVVFALFAAAATRQHAAGDGLFRSPMRPQQGTDRAGEGSDSRWGAAQPQFQLSLRLDHGPGGRRLPSRR
jgi:hypothetical protein